MIGVECLGLRNKNRLLKDNIKNWIKMVKLGLYSGPRLYIL
jgi:hypothetical protein